MTITKNDKLVISWLLLGCFLVALMVVIGGITRLTNSGLSIVEWKLIGGMIPPLNESQWLEKFELYKQFPEYKLEHSHFVLSDFKSIFFWEYLHRMLGRFIGIVFLIPCIFFLITKKFRKGFTKKVVVLFLLGGVQGFVGWFMVKSGLVDRPSVSHFRLAIHLMMALILYSITFWFALDLLSLKKKVNKSLLYMFIIFLALLLLQIFYGALVAGLKAGLVYNTFPMMGDSFVPKQILTSFKATGISSFFVDAVNVQFVHRYLGKVLCVFGLFIFIKSILNKQLSKSIVCFLLLLFIQFLLGVITLVYNVPLSFAVLHQFAALVLLTSTIYIVHSLKK